MRKMTPLGEQDDKSWYRLINSMSVGELRQRQQMMRDPVTLHPQILAQAQQGLQFEPRSMDRDLVHPPEIISSPDGRHLAAQLPPLPPVLTGQAFNAPGAYGLLPPNAMETVARQQEILYKQSIARMEMNAILQHKELERHQKIYMENPVMLQHLGSSPAVFRGRQRLQDSHNVFSLDAGRFQMSGGPYPRVPVLHRERGRRQSRRTANQKCSIGSEGNFQVERIQTEEKNTDESPGGEKEPESEEQAGEAKASKEQVELTANTGRKSFKHREPEKECGGAETGHSDAQRDLSSIFQEKVLYAPTPLSALPYMFSYSLLPSVQQMFMSPSEGSTVEDLCKWTVEDVYEFIINIPTCSEHAKVFKDHLIDGETLPLLTEDHLLDTLGLKLGPALKIRSQVLRKIGGALFRGRDMMTLSTPPIEKCLERPCDLTPPQTCSVDLATVLPLVNNH